MRSREAELFEQALLAGGGKKKFLSREAFLEMVEECRAINSRPYELPPDVKFSCPWERREAGGMDTVILRPAETATDKPVILYFHGGSFLKHAINLHWFMLERFSDELECCIYAPDYPLAPQHDWQDGQDAAKKIYEELLETVPPERIIFMGDSAGGSILLAFAGQLADYALPKPARLILLSPVVDMKLSEQVAILKLDDVDPMIASPGIACCREIWAAGLDTDDPRISPIYGDLKNLPPILYYTGTREILWPDARRFAAAARAQGAEIDYREYEDMNHVFVGYPIPEAKKAQDEIVAEIKKVWREAYDAD